MAYDANGNMVKDLDRNIVTISYNLLNLPEYIQFGNGNVIQNTYDAGGQKLRSDYYTSLSVLTTPIAVGQIRLIIYSPTTFRFSGTAYIGNVEYNISKMGKTVNNITAYTDIYTFSRLYNAEGYAENLSSPNYYYYRKDHLGNNREVWLANTNTTVQRTQYYSSGLPWAESTGGSVQKKKYSGKEFVEMHGLDEYDSQARWFYPTGDFTTTMDPLAEKYYSISPYAWCEGNPVRKVDIDGRDPGDFFKTQNSAAKDWGKYYNGKSIKKGKEYGSTIYKTTKNGQKGYSYTVANEGEDDNVTISPAPKGKLATARIHSHGRYEKNMENDDFSNRDKWACYNNKVDGYVATPNGTLLKYNVHTAITTIITKDLQSDPKDPESNNKNQQSSTKQNDNKANNSQHTQKDTDKKEK